jgi:hypothetical protein
MKKFLLVAVTAALPAAGCIQTLPDGSVAATPQTSSLLGQPSGDLPPAPHQIREGNRVVAADPDQTIRAELMRDRCQTFGSDKAVACRD